METYRIQTQEVDIICDWMEELDNDDVKQRVVINIKANGDLPHHVIEGIVDCLRKIQPSNCHLY